MEKAVPVPVHNSPTCLQSQRLSVLPLQTPPETRPSSPSPPPPPPAQLGASREVCSSPPLNSSPSRRPALLLPREKVSAAGAAGWVGVARGSGNGPKAPPPPASRPTARPPGERKLFFQKLRGSERTVCAPQGQVGKWSRRRRGEAAKGGERGARFLAKCQPFEVAPSSFNPLAEVGRTNEGEGNTTGQTPSGARTRSPHPPITAFPTARKCGAERGVWRNPGWGRGRRAPEGPSLRTAPHFLRSPTISSFPRPEYDFPSAVVGEEGRAPSPRLARAPPLRSCQHFLLTSGAAKRHAIYLIRIFKPAIQKQGLGRGSSSAEAPGGGVLGANLVPSVNVAFRLLFAKKRLFDAGRNGKF